MEASQLAKQTALRKFNTIVAAEIIEHVEDPYEFLRTLRALLVDDGILILTTPNPLGFPAVVFEYFLSERFYFAKDHTFYFPPRWVKRLLVRTGFQLDAIRGVGLWPLALPCPAALSYQLLYRARLANDSAS